MSEKSFVTPYAAAKLVNARLEELEIDKTIPPQMMYNYSKKGYIKSVRTEDGKIQISLESLAEWLSKYEKRCVALASIS